MEAESTIVKEERDLAEPTFEHYIVGPFFIVRLPSGKLKLEARAVRAKNIDKRISRNSIKLLGREDVSFEDLAKMCAMAMKGGYTEEAMQYFLDGMNGFIDRKPAETKEVYVARRLQPTELIVNKYLFAKMWLSMVRAQVDHYISTPQAAITRIGLMLGINTPDKRKEKWQELRTYIREVEDDRKSQDEVSRRNREKDGLRRTLSTEASGVGEAVPMRNDLLGPDGGDEGSHDGEEVPSGVRGGSEELVPAE